MGDIKQALRDFVATSNSGKYATEDEVFAKFPEFDSYDRQLLRDFVSTSNSGKYATEEEVFAKFPEFNIDVKKKDSSQVGSQKTQPTSGSKPAPSSNKPFAGSIDYLDQAPKFGEVSGLPKVPGTEGVVPAQKKVEQKPQQQQPKRTIVRGEEADQAIAESLSPQAPVAESTQPVKPVAPMTVEEGQLQKVIEKEKSKPAEFINYQDIDKLYSDPENSTKDYFSMFLDNAKKSEKGDVEYGKNLRDAYAGEFIDEEFENEYRLSSEIDNIDRKMRTELASLSEKAKTDPNAANLLQTKTNEYLSIINKKQKDLDSAREQNNQRFKNRIAEIDNLFKTGEAALREDSLLAEKNELVRKMNLIELAKNPNKLKDSVSKMEYDNIPGATAQDKLTNYLNSRLTAYDLFYNADKEADSLPREMRGNIKDSYSKLKSELKDLYYLTSLRRYQNAEDRPGFFEATGEAFSREFLDGGIDFSDSPQIHSENLQTIAKNAGIEFSDKDKSYIEITSAPADPYSGEWWGDMFGNTLAFGANIAVTAPIGSGVLKVGEGIVKSTPRLMKLAEYGLKRYSKLSSTGQKITNGIFNSLDEGYNFEMANQLIYDGESDELTFLTGIGGAVMAAPVNKLLSKTGKLLFGKSDEVVEAVAGKAYTREEAAALEALGAQTDDVRNFLSGVTKENGADDYVYMLQGTFGNKAPEAIKQIQKVGAVLIARPTGETAQEMGEELTSIYKQSDSFEAFQKEFSKRFPDADAATQFVVASYVMGLGFGLGNYVGDVFSAQSKKSFDQLSPEQQAIATEAIKQATEDVNNADAEAINEIELDEASRPKSKEEEEWSAKEAEIKQGIDNSTKRVNELDGLRNEIYSAYNITDPKTEDISVLSETDAVKLELLNKEIKKAQEAKIKDEIEMEIHNKNKPVVDQTPVNAIHAKDLETKKETDAVQEPSTEEVLPRQQGATTETGGEPQGMGQSVQGEKATQQGQEVSQESVTLNKEPFTEDVAPEQKAKIEEQNKKDEEEAVTEIYDFNDEIKSIGTKEQFKAFLKTLVPEGVFSRIAWHNTSKPELTPREKQYYTNTRKNAEDTYKQENTFPAIIFGNNPKKATFDEVQDVDTEAVKGSGNDIVITDDLSPSIGADMNYREFVTTNAEQVIPLATKENIDAFKAFVEQQKASEKAKPATEQKVQPEISLSGLVDGWTAKSYYAFDPRKGNIMNFAMTKKSFAEVIDKDGKKYVVVGLALEGNKRAYGAGSGRDRFSFASAELNETTPDNIVEILENAARDNFKELYKDFDYEKEAIKPITEINPELPVSQPPQATEQVTPQAQEVKEEKVSEVEQEVAPEEEAKVVEEASKNEGIKPKNMQDLIGIYRKVFGLSFPKAVSAAMVSNRLIKQMAKRAGVTPEQMYQRLSFQKANEKDLPQGVKMQVDAWHGSPYEFDKFTTEKIGTGEGAQAFGWGLYFTDLKNIAEAYARKLSGDMFSYDGKDISENAFNYLDLADDPLLDIEWDENRIKELSKIAIEKINKEYIPDFQEIEKISRSEKQRQEMPGKIEAAQNAIKELEDIIKSDNITKAKNKNLYKVSLQKGKSPSEYTWLEWDKKLTDGVINKIEQGLKNKNYGEKLKLLNDEFNEISSRSLSKIEEKAGDIKGKNVTKALSSVFENWDKSAFFDDVISRLSQSEISDMRRMHEIIVELNKIRYYGLDIASIQRAIQAGFKQQIFNGKLQDSRSDDIYSSLSGLLGGPKQASLFLLENGIDGVKYPAESISRGATSETARGFNYVVFDENAVSIEEVVKFQKDAEKARGAMMIGMDGQAIIYALTDPNISTPLHELAHVFEHYLTESEKNQIIKAAKTKGWTTETSEYFARGFEKYLAEGKSNNPIFEKFKQFLLDVYNAIKGSPIDVKLNKQMKAIYAEMLGEDITEASFEEDLDQEVAETSEFTEEETQSAIKEYEDIMNKPGIDKLDAKREFIEKYGALGERVVDIDSNFDNILDKLGAIKTCTIEIIRK
jgi:hypothetical protein